MPRPETRQRLLEMRADLLAGMNRQVDAGNSRCWLASTVPGQRIQLGLNVLSATFLKNVMHPLFVVGLILALPMDRDTARAALLLCALPSGFFGVLFGLRYGLESRVAGSTLIVSSLASVVTVSVALVLTAGW